MTTIGTHVGPARQMAQRSTAAIILVAAGLGVAAFLILGLIKDKPVDPVLPNFSTSSSSTTYPNLDQLGKIKTLNLPELAPTTR